MMLVPGPSKEAVRCLPVEVFADATASNEGILSLEHSHGSLLLTHTLDS